MRMYVSVCVRVVCTLVLVLGGFWACFYELSNLALTFIICIFSLQEISNLTPLSPEVISRQATINIGTIGHVAHGKSTVVKAISGVQTVRFKNELERNITIKLGEWLLNCCNKAGMRLNIGLIK